MSSVVEVAEAAKTPVSRPKGIFRTVILGQRQALFGLLVILAFVVIALLSPFIAPDPKEKVGPIFASPGGDFLLGLDGGGADMLKLLIAGTQVSLIVGFAAAAVSAFIGGLVGLVSGYFGGKVDTVLMRFTDYVLVIPDVPLMVVAAALFGRSLTNIIIIIGVIYWTSTARIIRAQVMSVRERVYVRRARSLGAGHLRLLGRHVLPQIAPLIVANTVLLVAYAIFAETFITFLGLGDPSLTSWGRLIQNAFTDDAILNEAWWAIVPPGICVAIIVLASTMVGQSIEDALNPRLAVGHLSVRRFGLRMVPQMPSRAERGATTPPPSGARASGKGRQ